jgi:CBS domain-containing protein
VSATSVLKLSDFLVEARVVLPLTGSTLLEAAEALQERLALTGAVANAERLRDRIAEERSEDMVLLGDRAFVLHYRTDAVTELAVALGTSPTVIRRQRDAEESSGAQVVLMIVAPPREAARYLQLVRGFVRLFSRDSAVTDVLAATTDYDLVALGVFAEYQLPRQLTVRDVMTERPRTTQPDLLLRDAARELITTGLGALPVVDEDGRLLGMLSERELVRHLLTTQVLSDPKQHAQPGVQRKTVRDAMTRQVLCVAPEQPIAEVASLMSNKDVERVPVVREGKLVGFLTRGDIVRKLLGF